MMMTVMVNCLRGPTGLPKAVTHTVMKSGRAVEVAGGSKTLPPGLGLGSSSTGGRSPVVSKKQEVLPTKAVTTRAPPPGRSCSAAEGEAAYNKSEATRVTAAKKAAANKAAANKES